MENSWEEEIFCLKYELNTFAEAVLHNSGERWVKGFLPIRTEKEHLDRYDFACNLAANKEILDMACGSGFGSHLMMTKGKAKSITGVDLDDSALRYANHRFKNEKITNIKSDATNFKSDKKFDLIVSFETIEHIPNYTDFINNLYTLLDDNGKIIISTPINKKTTTELKNPYHVIEWSFEDFQNLWKDKFIIESVYLQKVAIPMEYMLLIKMKNWIKSFLLKEKHWKKTRIILGKDWEKFENQYDMSKCVGGFQTLILHKK